MHRCISTHSLDRSEASSECVCTARLPWKLAGDVWRDIWGIIVSFRASRGQKWWHFFRMCIKSQLEPNSKITSTKRVLKPLWWMFGRCYFVRRFWMTQVRLLITAICAGRCDVCKHSCQLSFESMLRLRSQFTSISSEGATVSTGTIDEACRVGFKSSIFRTGWGWVLG